MSPYVQRLRETVGHDLLLLPSVSGVIFDDEGRALLALDADTERWVAPGGTVEPGETPTESVVRELHEEIGVVVEPGSVLGVFGGEDFVVRYRNGDQVAFVVTVYECRVLDGVPAPDHDEVREVRFVGEGELAALDLAPWARTALPAVFAAHRAPRRPAARPSG